MQGKTYLRESIESLYEVELTNGGDTANKRIDWNVEKSHANDACVITNLKIDNENCNLKDWKIIPLRVKLDSGLKIKWLNGFKHRDIIEYTKRNGEKYFGYIASFVEKRNSESS